MKPHEKFNYNQDFKTIDFRQRPELYQIGIGEQGVLSVEPYKSEILPHWRFATPDVARKSSEKIYALFLEYKERDDFIGMDMARKFLQMGITRARRYANYKGGKKYDGPVPEDKKGQSGAHGRTELPRGPEDPVKAESARIFQEKYLLAKNDAGYLRLMKRHREQYEQAQNEQAQNEQAQHKKIQLAAKLSHTTNHQNRKRKTTHETGISDELFGRAREVRQSSGLHLFGTQRRARLAAGCDQSRRQS